MDSHYDILIKTELKELFSSGKIQAVDPREYFNIVEHFYPISNNRINWGQVERYLTKSVEGDKDSEIGNFIDRVLESDGKIASEQVIIIGDDLLNFGYKLEFERFRQLAPFFFKIPQHSYVIFCDTKKCLNYTFEDDIYFGYPTGYNFGQ